MTALAAVIVLVAAPGVALADDKAAAREFYRKGTQHYELGEYQEALEQFKSAYRAYPEPSLLFNIGQAYRQLGDKEKAIGSYRMYLIKLPEAPNRQQVREMVDKLEAALQQERAARSSPSEGTLPPPDPPPPALAPAPAPAEPLRVSRTAETGARPTPIYKKWWLWTAVGVAAAGVAVGVGLGLTVGSPGSTPEVATDLGTVKPF